MQSIEEMLAASTYPIGTLLKGSKAAVYVIMGGKRRLIVDPQGSLMDFGGVGQIREIADEELARIPKGRRYGTVPDGTLIHLADNGDSLIVAGGQAQEVTEPELLADGSSQPTVDINATQLEDLGLNRSLAVEADGQPVSRQVRIRRYISSLPALPPEPPGPVVLSGSDRQTSFQGIQYNLHDQVVKLTANLNEFTVISPVADAMYPGALIQGQSLVGSRLAPIPLDRAPGTVTVTTDFVSSPTISNASLRVAKPTVQSVTEARRQLISQMNPTTTAGAVSYQTEVARSLEQGMLRLGANYKNAAFEVDAKGRLDTSLETNTVMVNFRQEYYTLVFEPEGSPPNFFADNVRLGDVKKYATQDSPPCYISSVTYGRSLLILFTAKASTTQIEAAVKARLSLGIHSAGAELDSQYKEVLETSQVKVLSTGATGRTTIDLLGDPFGALGAYLGTGADFSLNNPGAPIAYTARYLKDSQVASAALTTDYSETTSVWADDVTRSGFEVYDHRDYGGPVSTGIPVAGGDEVTITASGQLWCGIAFAGKNGPEGWLGYKAGDGFPLIGEVPTRCSQLSSTMSIFALFNASASVAVSGRLACSDTPRTSATACGTSSSSESGARSTSHTPSGQVPTRSLATSRASRVLPQPPVPVRVKRFVIASILLTSTISRSRPMKLVLAEGRLCLAGCGGSSSEGAVGWVCTNLPATISACRARVVAPGSMPRCLLRASRRRWYCASASCCLPQRAYRRIKPACTTSFAGSSLRTFRSTSMADP
jgi:hypothetical protein